MEAKVVLADFATEEEYQVIKGPHGTAFPTLALHRKALAETAVQLQQHGHEVIVEICDQAGYEEFCRLQQALNTPQTVSAYVVLKHGRAEKKVQPGLQHQNITVHRSSGRRLFGVLDESGEVIAAYKTAEEADEADLPSVEMVPNFTWEQSDWTDENGGNWISSLRLAAAFRDLCEKTGKKKKYLADLCGKNPATFSRYFSGETPVPEAVWRLVEGELPLRRRP